MFPVARLVIVVPLVLALVSFVLTSLALFAGRQQGFMEDYAIVRLNTSGIGHNLFDRPKDRDRGKDNSRGGILGGVEDLVGVATDGVRDKLNDLAGNVADKITDRLGISDWYSLHVTDSCEGGFVPSAAVPSPQLNTTNCTAPAAAYRFNLTELLDRELRLGPSKLNLADIGWSDGLQDMIDLVNDVLLGLFILYVLSMGFSGLSMLLSAGAAVLPATAMLRLANLVVAALGALSVLIASIAVSVAAHKGVKKINDRGQRVGLSAKQGTKFQTLSWVATGFMLAVAGFWLAQLLLARRRTKKDVEA